MPVALISRLAASAAALLALAAMHPARAAAQISYPLVCRGGPGLRLAPEVSGGTSRLLLRFTRGRRGAVGGALDPGTCAWQDRGVRDSQPAVLCFGPVTHLSFEMASGREIAWLRAQVAGSAPVIFWEGGERPDGTAYQPSNPAEIQYYRAYHDAAHACLAVTHVGP